MALTKFNFNSFDVTTAASSGLAFNSSANGFTTVSAGALTLLTTNTISSSVSSSNFTSSISSTYDTYLFKLINIHPASQVFLGFNFTALRASKTLSLCLKYLACLGLSLILILLKLLLILGRIIRKQMLMLLAIHLVMT